MFKSSGLPSRVCHKHRVLRRTLSWRESRRDEASLHEKRNKKKKAKTQVWFDLLLTSLHLSRLPRGATCSTPSDSKCLQRQTRAPPRKQHHGVCVFDQHTKVFRLGNRFANKVCLACFISQCLVPLLTFISQPQTAAKMR